MSLICLEYKDFFDNNKEKKLEFSENLLLSSYNVKSLFALKVDGESMQPVINDKALIVTDLSQKIIENESIYVVYNAGKMWVKKAIIDKNTTTFISINKKFAHLIFNEKDTRVLGKVLLTFTNL